MDTSETTAEFLALLKEFQRQHERWILQVGDEEDVIEAKQALVHYVLEAERCAYDAGVNKGYDDGTYDGYRECESLYEDDSR